MAALLTVSIAALVVIAFSAWRQYVEAGRMLDEMRDALAGSE